MSEEVTGTKISPKTEKMTKGKTASGSASFNCGDAVAHSLEGMPVEKVKEMAEYLDIDTSKYEHLNPGHQRMILGSMFRKLVRDQDKKEEGSGAPWFESIAEQYRPEPEPEQEQEATA